MAKKLYEEESIRDIACAIREKCGNEAAKYKCCDMGDAIRNLPTSGGGDASVEDGIIERTLSGSYTNDRVSNIRYSTFSECDLTEVSFPRATHIGSNAFRNCSKLTTANFPLATEVDNDVFYGCSKLTTVNLPLASEFVYGNCFAYCTSLTKISLPSVQELEDIDGGNMFIGCSNLEIADFLSLTSLYNNSTIFKNCSKLKALVLRSENICSLTYTYAFTGTPIASGTGYIYVPASVIDGYKAHSVWGTYANQFRILELYTVDGTTTGALNENLI